MADSDGNSSASKSPSMMSRIGNTVGFLAKSLWVGLRLIASVVGAVLGMLGRLLRKAGGR